MDKSWCLPRNLVRCHIGCLGSVAAARKCILFQAAIGALLTLCHTNCSLTFAFAVNNLAKFDPEQRWALRLQSYGRRFGVSEALS